MNKEIEVKILNICEVEIHKKLMGLGAEFLGKERQINQIFGDGANGLLVRLRTVEGVTTFTTKTPISCGEFKVRRELESRIVDAETFARQLEDMGFPMTWYLEKDRAVYQYKGTIISIDKYPDIPAFLEIEGGKENIRDVVMDLGFQMKDTSAMNFEGIVKMFRPGVRELRFG